MADHTALMADIRAEMRDMRADMRSDMASLRADMRSDMASLQAGVARLDQKVDRHFVWIVGVVLATFTALFSAMVGVTFR